MTTSPSPIHPIYAIVSPSRFLRSDALDHLLGAMGDAGGPVAPARFEGPSAVLANVLDEVRTPSLLGERRVVVVDDADPFITAHRTKLESYASTPSDCGSLIFLCNSLPKTTRLSKIIQKVGRVIAVEAPKGRAVVRWTVERARTSYGKRLSMPAAQALFDHLGDSVGVLDAELSKLAVYVGDRGDITPADIDALTGHHREEKVFGVTDAIASGDAAGALRQWEQVLATDRAAPARAVAGLAWGIRRLLEARRDWENGANLQELSRRLYTDPSVLKRRLERVTVEGLERQQRDLLEADLAVKTGASTVGSAVEKFILTHSTAGDAAC